MRPILIVSAALLPIAACDGGSVSERNASVAEVAAKAQGLARIEPGLWTTTTDVHAIDVPGINDARIMEGVTAQLKKQHAISSSHCVTPEEASRPPSEMFAGKDSGDCRYDKFDMGGGRLDAAMTCSREGLPGTTTMTMAGNYSPTSYDLAVEMKVAVPAMPGGGMTMKANTKGARTGACG